MIYGSVCSGIEAASVAWHPLGWRGAFLSEIDPFPRVVLQHHYPETPLHGDFTTIQAGQYEPIQLLVGGTPCQSFSVAGLRGGLADDRGNLALQFLKLADRLRPRWVVWENVPGVLSSNGGRDFGAILGGLVELGYGFAYRVLDAQFFGLPQRRRRVFVVGCAGDWRRAAAVLFERHSLSGHPAPRRETGERAAPSVSARPTGGGGLGTDFDCDGGLIAFGGNNTAGPIDVATAVNAHGGPCGRQDFESETFIAHSLRADGFDASEDGTGRGTPLVPVAFDTTQMTSKLNRSQPKPGDPCHPLAAGTHPPAIAFTCKDHGADAGELAPTLRGMGHDASHPNGGGQVAVAFQSKASASQSMNPADVAPSLDVGKSDGLAALQGMAVRRLTPEECEALQGFSRGYTLVPYRGKPAADGPRYKALGNSMAVPVMAWIGRQIELVDAIERVAAVA